MGLKEYKLGDILKRRRESIKVDNDNEYKLVTIRLYHKGVILRKIEKGENIKSSMSIIKEGDFILSGIDARNGAFGIVPKELDGGIVTNDFWCLDPDEEILDRDFLLFLTTTNFFDTICKLSSDGTTQRIRLQKEKFFNYTLRIPKLIEQRNLVKNLTDLKSSTESISSELNHQLDLIKQLRQAFLREAMQGKLVKSTNTKETGKQLLKKIKAEKAQLIADKKLKKEKELPPITEDEIPFEIPEHWAWCRLREIISYTENLDIHKKLSSETIINYVDIASIDNKNYLIKEVKKSTVEELSTRARRVLKKDYIIYSTVRPYLKNIAIIENELPNFIGSTGFNVFKPINSNIKYLFYFLLSPDLNKKYEETMVGFNSPSITNEQFENTLFPLPPLHEQEQIVAKLEELMAFCDGLEQSIKESQGYNEMLLQQVLREALQPKEEV